MIHLLSFGYIGEQSWTIHFILFNLYVLLSCSGMVCNDDCFGGWVCIDCFGYGMLVWVCIDDFGGNIIEWWYIMMIMMMIWFKFY